MEESFEAEDLDNFIIKDKKYYGKKRKRKIKLLIILFFVITAIIIIIVVIKINQRKFGGKIICKYKSSVNENVHLININEDIDFSLIIDEKDFDKKIIILLKMLEHIRLYFIFKTN